MAGTIQALHPILTLKNMPPGVPAFMTNVVTVAYDPPYECTPTGHFVKGRAGVEPKDIEPIPN